MPRDAPYTFIGPASDFHGLLYVTKPATICGLMSKQEILPPPGIAILGRYGLPSLTDVVWIERLSASQPIYFLGDADPVDLLSFAWLRLRLPRLNFYYIGVSDSLITALGMSISPQATIRLSPDEQGAVDLVHEVFVNLPAWLGPKCATMLDEGRKIEIEALISFGANFLPTIFERCQAT